MILISFILKSNDIQDVKACLLSMCIPLFSVAILFLPYLVINLSCLSSRVINLICEGLPSCFCFHLA